MNQKAFENNKKKIQSWVSHEYPDVIVSWNGIHPTINIPDNLIGMKDEIVSYVQEAIRLFGGDVRFYYITLL